MSNLSFDKKLENLTQDEINQIVKEKLTGKIERYPRNFWTSKRGKEYFIKTIKILYEEHKNWSREEILEKSSSDELLHLGFYRPLKLHFNGSYEKAMEEILHERKENEK